jgi:hypothetical protein
MLSMRTPIWLAGALLLAPLACNEDKGTTPGADVRTPPAASSPVAAASSQAPAAAPAPAPAPDTAPASSTAETAPSSSGAATAKNAAPKSAPSSAAPTGPVVGETSSVTAAAKVDAPYHCNDKYPTKFVTAGGSNVSYPSEKVAGGCSGESMASVSVPYVPTAAGAGSVRGKLKYGICDKDECKILEKDMTLPFTASAK